MALALANRATQTVGIPFAVSSFKGDGQMPQHPFKSLMSSSSDESELVQLIKMGFIK